MKTLQSETKNASCICDSNRALIDPVISLGNHYLLGLVRRVGGYVHREIQESQIQDSQR